MTTFAIINLVVFTALLSFLFQLAKKEVGLSRRVLVGLVAGTLFGFYLQGVFGYTDVVTEQTLEWTGVIANSYVNLLYMIIMPLILIAWLVAFAYERPPIDEVAFRGLQALAVVIGIIISWLSYFRWQTPVGAIQDKLGADSWVRYASLDAGQVTLSLGSTRAVATLVPATDLGRIGE